MKFALALAFAVAVLPYAAAAQPVAPPAISVTGEGVATAAPDIAIVTSGVVTRADTAAAALKANAAAMTKALTALKKAGVADRDVATSGLSVQPQYENGSFSGGRALKLVGYEARNVVTIRSRSIDGFGELVDQLAAAGSNQIDNLAFDVAERGAKLDEARRAAVADARRKAELLAKEAGVKLGSLVSLDEQDGFDGPVQPFASRAKAMDVATPIARGEQELRVRVTAKWAIQP